MTSTTNQETPISVGAIKKESRAHTLSQYASKAPRPDQLSWEKNQRKARKNKRRLFAAGGRVNFNN